MKTYLRFSNEGEITELKTKNILFKCENYTDYNFIDNINHNKYNFIILYNKMNEIKNITSLPFYKKEIYGNFLLFAVDNVNNIKSFTENKLMKFINIEKKNIEDYSSDDFSLSDE